MESDKLSNRPWQTTAMGNIQRVVAVDVSQNDFESNTPFFIRSGAGSLVYCPWGNNDTEPITKTVEAQVYFVDPEMCRKIFATSTATDIYIGYGV
jgi:hypothetical protein